MSQVTHIRMSHKVDFCSNNRFFGELLHKARHRCEQVMSHAWNEWVVSHLWIVHVTHVRKNITIFYLDTSGRQISLNMFMHIALEIIFDLAFGVPIKNIISLCMLPCVCVYVWVCVCAHFCVYVCLYCWMSCLSNCNTYLNAAQAQTSLIFLHTTYLSVQKFHNIHKAHAHMCLHVDLTVCCTYAHARTHTHTLHTHKYTYPHTQTHTNTHTFTHCSTLTSQINSRVHTSPCLCAIVWYSQSCPTSLPFERGCRMLACACVHVRKYKSSDSSPNDSVCELVSLSFRGL